MATVEPRRGLASDRSAAKPPAASNGFHDSAAETSRRSRGKSASWDVVVVGGGIIGLAVAREILHRRPGTRLLLLEAERSLAQHQTGHNSGVIHSGVYYAPGSLKAKLCVEGNRRMYEYCLEHDIPFERCGKLIVATRPEELSRLDELHRRGQANGVRGLEELGPERLREVEPEVAGLKALHVPDTGIVDFRLVAASFARDVEALGGTIRTGARVTAVRTNGARVDAVTAAETFSGRRLVTCGGLHSDRLAAMAGAPRSPRIVPFRGTYYVLRGVRSTAFQKLIYPVPDPAFPFLGIHLTRQISGEVWVGPNAVLALSRHGYRPRDLDLRDCADVLGYRGFRALTRRHWRVGMSEVRSELSKPAFAAALRRLAPMVQVRHLGERRSGIRAQAVADTGELLDDFWLDRTPNALHVRNAPSPAATSSLALATAISGAVLEGAEHTR
jgi:L-2-hydroxyglutarate oxidase LhgO